MTLERPSPNGTVADAEHRLSHHILHELAGTLAPPNAAGRLWIGLLIFTVCAGAAAFSYQLMYGLQVTAMREYVSWGVYMTNFVFFIGVSHAGTLISAILRVTNAEWRRSITRMAEAITVFALAVGAPMVIIDMGRPDRVLNVIIHGRLSSPILWDVCSIATYMSGSILYLYVAMIPDMALLCPTLKVWERPTWRQRIYRFLSLGYRGTPEQKKFLDRALATMAIIIIPVAISVHTVVSWIFGMTLRPGWHSTIFGPYFVVGAIFSGTAAIITAMAIFRKVYHLDKYLTVRQFQNLGRLLLALNLLYIYFTLAEYLTTWYGSEAAEMRLIELLMGHTAYGASFWLWAALGLFLPALIIMFPAKKSLITRLVVASILINIGMWIKRYLIIVPTLMTPYIPAEAADVVPAYIPTWVEWTVTAGGLAMFLLLFTVFAKFFPIISIWETVEGVQELGAKNIGVDVELPPEKPKFGRQRPATAPALAVGALCLLGTMASAAEPEAAPEKAPVIIAVESGIREDERVLIATLRTNSPTGNPTPLAGAELTFYVKRLFGRLPIGSETTGTNGEAVVSFPLDLSSLGGELLVETEITAPAEYTGVLASTKFEAANTVSAQSADFPRAVWAPRAPWAVGITIFTLLSIVWSTFTFVIVQLVRMRNSPHP